MRKTRCQISIATRRDTLPLHMANHRPPSPLTYPMASGKRSDPGQLSDIAGGVTGSEMESDSDFEGPALKNTAQPEKSSDVKNKSAGSKDKAAPKTVPTEEPPTKKAKTDPPTSLEQGRVVRKATDPLPVSAPSKSGATTVQKPVITRPEVSRPPCTYMPPLIPLGPLATNCSSCISQERGFCVPDRSDKAPRNLDDY